MKILHMYPTNDDMVHVVSLTSVCPCAPQIQEEGHLPDNTHTGETHIHHSVRPMVKGHRLAWRKSLSIDGDPFVELPPNT